MREGRSENGGEGVWERSGGTVKMMREMNKQDGSWSTAVRNVLWRKV